MPEVQEVLYAGALQNGWMDYGWTTRELGKGAATVDLSDYGGWILGKPGTPAKYGGLRFKIAGAKEGSFLVRLEGSGKFERVVIGPQHRGETADGFTEYFVPLSKLNPDGKAFEQVVFQGNVKGPLPKVRIDAVGLTTVSVSSGPVAAEVDVKLSVDCKAQATPISPYIYGIALDFQRHGDDSGAAIGATVRRWGGNNSSRYNWKLGNAWNAGHDWYFMNLDYVGVAGWSWKNFLAQQKEWGLKSAITLPMLGWVAKDTTSVSWPVSEHPSQQQIEPYKKVAGNGRLVSGNPIPSGPPSRTSVPAPPAFVEEWVKEIQAAPGGDTMLFYFLDNEPAVWHNTHRDVHPEPLTYDELWKRTLDYAVPLKKAYPNIKLAGPAEWGWEAYFDSPADTATGRMNRVLKPDRRAHGNKPLIEWYLEQVAAYEKKHKVRLVDVLDLHHYPMAQGIGHQAEGATDRATNALRLRTTRALWDPTYKDESWINDTVMLLPRMKKWIADYAPGMEIALGEYSFGANGHPSGALAQAEALGRFAQHGVYAAFNWMYPPKDSAAAHAFRAFRNYDGKGARFGDFSLAASASGPASLFASRSADGKTLVLIALNLDPDKAAVAPLTLNSCGKVKSQRAFQTTFGPKGLEPLPGNDFKAVPMRPYSITVVELGLE
jgi:hypothetical protein